MENINFETLAVAFPAAIVFIAWIQDLRGQLKDLREDHERLQNDYIQHLKGGYNTGVELALKKIVPGETEMKQQPLK